MALDSLIWLASGLVSLAAVYYLLSLKPGTPKKCPEQGLQLLAVIAVIFLAGFNFLNFFGFLEFVKSIETIALTLVLVLAVLYYKCWGG